MNPRSDAWLNCYKSAEAIIGAEALKGRTVVDSSNERKVRQCEESRKLGNQATLVGNRWKRDLARERGEERCKHCTQATEPPCTERYARWCERTATQLMGSLLLDSIRSGTQVQTAALVCGGPRRAFPGLRGNFNLAPGCWFCRFPVAPDQVAPFFALWDRRSPLRLFFFASGEKGYGKRPKKRVQ